MINIYKNLAANMILNGERRSMFILKSGTRLRCPPLPLLFIVLQVLTSVGRQENEIEDIQTRKEEIKLSLVAYDIQSM